MTSRAQAAVPFLVLGWAAASWGSGGLVAQSGRIWGTSTMQYVEMRPLRVDSVLESEVPGDGLVRRLPGGGVARCIQGEPYCRFSRSGEEAYAIPTIHDLSATVWGFMEGVRVYARGIVRGEVAGGDELWPRSGDATDLVLAYVEWNRRRVRVRAGRQWKVSGLGYHNYDGASVRVRPAPYVVAEVYGGWSLARGLNEPRTGSALAAIETLVPNRRSMIIGLSGSYRPSAAVGLTALYQRELLENRRGLISERVALDGLYRQGRWTLEGAFEADLPSRVVNEATARVRAALGGRAHGEFWMRRYQPFFELWTIWGAFTPVAFNEVGVGGSWHPSQRSLSFGLRGSRRSYGEAHTSTAFGGARSSAWRITATGSGRVTAHVTLQGRYGLDVGPGAAASVGAIRGQWDPREGISMGLRLEAFQTDYEFRVQDGTVFGMGVDGGLELGERASVTGGLTLYRHRSDAAATGPDWSQARAHLRLRWSVGAGADATQLGGAE